MDNNAKFATIDPILSQQLHRALTANKDELFQVMQEFSGEALLASLRNPALDENHLLTLFKRRGLPEELFLTLYAAKRLCENHKVKFILVCHPETPSHIIATLLPQLTIFELLKICIIPGMSADHRLAAERGIIQRLPVQPLGNKLTLARRGTASLVEALLHEGVPLVVEACLDNPHLKEGALFQFLASPKSTAETISMVARNGRWKGRPNIRLAILKNPRTPGIWFTMFLPGMPPGTLRELLSSPRLTFAQKELVRQAGHGNRTAR